MKSFPIGTVVIATVGFFGIALARDVPQSGPAADGSPAWLLEQAADIHVHDYAAMCTSDIAKFCTGKSGQPLRVCLSANKKQVSESCQTALAMPWQEGGFDTSHTPQCAHSVVCVARPANNPGGLKDAAGVVERVLWRSEPPNLGYKAIYPYELPPGGGGATAGLCVAVATWRASP